MDVRKRNDHAEERRVASARGYYETAPSTPCTYRKTNDGWLPTISVAHARQLQRARAHTPALGCRLIDGSSLHPGYAGTRSRNVSTCPCSYGELAGKRSVQRLTGLRILQR